MSEVTPALDIDRLTALVFELWSELHTERVHRLALETALVRAGVLDATAAQALAGDPTLREASLRNAGDFVGRLMRVLSERADERMPLRAHDSRHNGG